MNTPARLAVVALALAAVFGAAVGVGAAVGPIAAPESHAGAGSPAPAPAGPAYGGLAVAESGYRLEVPDRQLPAGTATLAFRVLGPDGAPVRAYEVEHDEDLHLVAVRRDLTGYQHLHPELGADGTWRTPVALTAGSWRVVVDTTPTALGEDLVLGTDVEVAGDYDPQPPPEPAAVTETDGYTVVLTGDLVAGRESELTLSVSRDGRPVTDLQSYLGAHGHLVALREGDLAYLHVHPVEPAEGTTPAPGPHVAFAATAPSPGAYRLFLDFRHGDTVHTAAFPVQVAPGREGGVPDEPAGHGHGG
ncbi:hypothetical protein ACI78Q_16205 [Geodermatophilus sp. SYSU D00705]